MTFGELANFIWSVADLLRGAQGNVILDSKGKLNAKYHAQYLLPGRQMRAHSRT